MVCLRPLPVRSATQRSPSTLSRCQIVQIKSLPISLSSQPEQQFPLRTRYARGGNELKLVVAGEGPPKATDPVLVKLLAHASAAREAVTVGTSDPMVSNYSKRHLWQLLRLNWLAPDVVTAIVEGTQPAVLTGRRLLRAADVPLSWKEQRRYFGFS
jgi:site-specific DNA recombinase